MVVNRLNCGHSEENHSLASCHSCNFICDAGTKCIEEETFERMVIKRSVCVRNVQTVVA